MLHYIPFYQTDTLVPTLELTKNSNLIEIFDRYNIVWKISLWDTPLI